MTRIRPSGDLAKPRTLHDQRLTREAANHPCFAQFGALIGVPCSGGVMFCHAPTPDKGIGMKGPDWWGYFGCDQCHRLQDGRDLRLHDAIFAKAGLGETRALAMMTAIRRTLQAQFDAGLLTMNGSGK